MVFVFLYCLCFAFAELNVCFAYAVAAPSILAVLLEASVATMFEM